MKIPITVLLFTTSKGHWNRTDIYKNTVNSLFSQIPVENWGGLIASLKMNDGQDDVGNEIGNWLVNNKFTLVPGYGKWAHGQDSHQVEFLNDIARVNNFIETPYILFEEDDWIIKPYEKDLEYWISRAIKTLEENPGIMQVRIPRFTNEFDRINGLKQKHGINTRAVKLNNELFVSGDYSNNPYIARTRDLRAALTILNLSQLPKHSEHGLGRALSLLGWSELPFAFFDPLKIRAGHCGTPIGQEDNLDQPLNSN